MPTAATCSSSAAIGARSKRPTSSCAANSSISRSTGRKSVSPPRRRRSRRPFRVALSAMTAARWSRSTFARSTADARRSDTVPLGLRFHQAAEARNAPSAAQIAAFRQRFAAQRGHGAAPSATGPEGQPPRAQAAARRSRAVGSWRARFRRRRGGFGGRPQWRPADLSATHTLTLTDGSRSGRRIPEARLSRRRSAQRVRRPPASPGRGRGRLLQQWPRRARLGRLAQRDAGRWRHRRRRSAIFRTMRPSICGCSPISASASTWCRSTPSCAAARCGSTSTISSTAGPRSATETATFRSPISPTGSNRSAAPIGISFRKLFIPRRLFGQGSGRRGGAD